MDPLLFRQAQARAARARATNWRLDDGVTEAAANRTYPHDALSRPHRPKAPRIQDGSHGCKKSTRNQVIFLCFKEDECSLGHGDVVPKSIGGCRSCPA
eukprot:4780437-Pyramimonas_sp.AAC.1